LTASFFKTPAPIWVIFRTLQCCFVLYTLGLCGICCCCCYCSRLTASFPGRYQKGKTSLDLNEARMMGFWDGSCISWTMSKQSAPRSRQITTPTPRQSTFTGRMLFLTPHQQRQSTESNVMRNLLKISPNAMKNRLKAHHCII